MSHIHTRTEATFEALNGVQFEDRLPEEALKQAFGLTDTELHILVVLALIQYDEKYARAWRYVFGAAENARITVGNLQLLFDYVDPIEFRSAFLPGSALRRNALIQFGVLENWGAETPTAFAPVFVPNRILSFLLAEDCFVDIAGCQQLQPGRAEGAKPRPVERDLLKAMQKRYAHGADRLRRFAPLGRLGIKKAAYSRSE